MRGSVIVLEPRDLYTLALLAIVKFVHSRFPPPWPEVVKRTVEESEQYLTKHSMHFDIQNEVPPSKAEIKHQGTLALRAQLTSEVAGTDLGSPCECRSMPPQGF